MNKLGEIRMIHDIIYRGGYRLEADETMLRELDEFENEDLTCNTT